MKVRESLFVILGSLLFIVTAMGTGHYGWAWVSGVVISAALIPVVRYGPRGFAGLFGAFALGLVAIGIWCTMSEGVVFYPTQTAVMLQGFIGGTVIYTAIAALLAVLARVLKLGGAGEAAVEHRRWPAMAGMVLLAGVAYLVYYEVFGAIVFQLYTKQFYPHAAEQVAAMGWWFPLYQVGRGVLMTLAVLPVIYSLRMGRWQAAVFVGLLVWILGGGASLLVPNMVMPANQRYAHIIEIMTQNVPLGMTAVWLLRPRARAARAVEMAVPVA
jgi:hypothetical protein